MLVLFNLKIHLLITGDLIQNLERVHHSAVWKEAGRVFMSALEPFDFKEGREFKQ
jgi:hypothetical protein